MQCQKARRKISALAYHTKSSYNSSASSTVKTAVVLAYIQDLKFACRIDSGADQIVVSDNIVTLLGDNNIFLPIILLLKPQRMLSVEGSPADVQG